MPVLRQRTQKDSDDIGPSPRFRYRLKTKLAIEDMQVTLRWDDEHAIWFDMQSLGNERDWHLRVMGEEFVEEGGRRSQVINDYDRGAEIGWKILEQAFVCVEPSGGTTYTNQRKILIHFSPVHGTS